MLAASFPVTTDRKSFNTLYTAGYGNTSPDKFLLFLAGKGVTHIYDIRRSCNPAGRPMLKPGAVLDIYCSHRGLTYLWTKGLGKPMNQTFEDYRESILTGSRKATFDTLALRIKLIAAHGGKPCLLCAEGNPFENDNRTPKCHRVILGTALAEMLGSNMWTVSHLIMA